MDFVLSGDILATLSAGVGQETGDRGVLIDLFILTKGARWRKKTNWCSQLPIGTWEVGICYCWKGIAFPFTGTMYGLCQGITHCDEGIIEIRVDNFGLDGMSIDLSLKIHKLITPMQLQEKYPLSYLAWQILKHFPLSAIAWMVWPYYYFLMQIFHL